MGNYVWLIGENLGATANNNSYYFWKHIVQRQDGIDKYFILEKTAANREIIKSLDEYSRKYIVWKNSLKHFSLYFKADMFFVTLSYRDVRPENLFGKKLNFLTVTPVVYLQHGITAIKQLGYTGNDYNNNIFRFVYYNPLIKQSLIEVNHFKPYQLYNGKFFPRYQEFVRRADNSSDPRTILWFVTWREYLGDNFATRKLLYSLKKVLSNPHLQDFLSSNNYILRLCLHSFFDVSTIKNLFENVHTPNIQWVHANSTDVMNEMANSHLLITDYSSVGFDFTFLNRPVVIFAPDFEEYSRKRAFYCEPEEFLKYAITSPDALVSYIIGHSYTINGFFRKRLPETIDYDYIRAGKHIDRLYDYFKDAQIHRITFLGYNFYGRGGTVSATYSLAEGLMERGYMVSLLSLKQNRQPQNVPCALNMKAFYDAKSKSKKERLKRILFRRKRYYQYLIYDKDKTNLNSYGGYALKKWLNTAGSETVISTRESLHPFLYDAQSDRIKNRLYFYHCSAAIFDEVFPHLSEQLQIRTPGKAVFVTENSRKLLVDHLGFEPYTEYLVLGNALTSLQIILPEDIQPVKFKEHYSGVYLLRLSQERINDIRHLLEYGKFLRDHQIQNIRIYVYGTGNYVNNFLDFLIEEELTDYIKYCGFTDNPSKVLQKYDAVVDFSANQSFGMTYIEGIFNGKMVFCPRNTGSLEVFDQIPEAFYGSFEELTQKIQSLPYMTAEKLAEYYSILAQKYSRDVITKKFLEYVLGHS